MTVLDCRLEALWFDFVTKIIVARAFSHKALKMFFDSAYSNNIILS
jgi:hypothetical protein